MNNTGWNVRRLEDGSIDYRHYTREAHAARRAVKTKTLRRGLHTSRRLRRGIGLLLLGLLAIAAFWNLPPLGPSDSRGQIPFQ